VSAVEKYEMPIEQYEALPSTVLSWKKQKQLGRFDPDLSRREREKLDAQYLEVANAGIEIGKRCRVGGTEGDRRGVVKFVGEVDELGGGGVWVGVEYDEPVGKNDGTVRGKRIFECKGNNFGGFVRASRVEVGDFPERLLEDEEEI
jgi:tubulin-specific chaperone B